jgi:hypothetical protein
LQKEIFLKTDAMELGPNEFLQLVLPLYGLSESGDYWNETLANHHLQRLQFTQSRVDFSLFFKTVGGRLCGLSGCYVDDLLRAATPNVRELLESTIREDFDCKASKAIKKGAPATQFIGLDLERELDSFFASMTSYISRLIFLADDATFDQYQVLRAKLLWICNSRPDICAFVSLCSSVTAEKFKTRDVRDINNVVHHLRSTADIRLLFPKLDAESLHLLVYTDAAFGIRDDKSSQGGYVVLLSDNSKKCCFLAYHSGKTRRVARSSMAAETLAFADGFDCAFTLREELKRLLGKHVPMLMLTDSAGLFDAITRHNRTSEGRLMLDIYAARESYRNREMDNIALIRSQHNIADAMTKVRGNSALLDLLRAHRIEHPVARYVLNPEARSSNCPSRRNHDHPT